MAASRACGKGWGPAERVEGRERHQLSLVDTDVNKPVAKNLTSDIFCMNKLLQIYGPRTKFMRSYRKNLASKVAFARAVAWARDAAWARARVLAGRRDI